MRSRVEQIGDATLYLGDCRDVLPTLEQADCVITDPPYGQHVYDRLSMPNTKEGSGTPSRIKLGPAYQKNNGPRMAQLARGDIGSIENSLELVAVEIGRLAKRWGVVFSDLETVHIWRQQLEQAGLRYVRTGAWVKPDAMPQFSGDRPAVGFEPCTIVHAQGPMHWNGGGRKAVWTHNGVKGSALDRPDHPCPKPLPLMLELLSLFSDPGETVLDPYMGSGTTGAAALMLGRKFVGVEIDHHYFDDTCKRLERVHRQPRLFAEPIAKAVQSDIFAEAPDA